MALANLVRRKIRALRRRVPTAGADLSMAVVLPGLDAQTGFPRFDRQAEPVASIIIPAFGELPMTLRCLRSIARAESQVPYEVIVVDDGSQPALSEAFQPVDGLRVVRLNARQGFVGASNKGAEAARAPNLVFLNNDTAVFPGWLEALLRRVREPGVGLVGAQLISPDGLVQEAGGIIWRDGSATNYGRRFHPDDPAVSFARRADYCSGACLMIQRELFEVLGGFDQIYAPAYYEDVDIAFAVRQRGLAVEYEPRARVFHFEGGTAGTDLDVGVKQFQRRNQRIFGDKWMRSLALQPLRSLGVEHARRHRMASSCLVVDRHIPRPRRDGGSKRLVHLLAEFRQLGCHVTFAAYDLADQEAERLELESQGVEVLRRPFVSSIKDYLREHGAAQDHVVLSRLGVARRLLPLVRRFCPQATLLFDSVDLRSQREAREALVRGDTKGLKRARKTERRELAVVQRADATLVTSPIERDYFHRLDPSAVIALVPTCYESVAVGAGFERRAGALFVGGFNHGPNLDGILWFLDEIWPRVRLVVPGFQLHIAGEDPPQELTRRAGDGVQVLGYVADLTSLYERCRMSIAPLRYGAGLKSKVHQSLARGVPCVATPTAAEGMGLMPDIHAVLAESADRFAEGVTRLNSDRDLWHRLSIEGRAHVEQYFSERAFKAGLQTALAARE